MTVQTAPIAMPAKPVVLVVPQPVDYVAEFRDFVGQTAQVLGLAMMFAALIA